MESGTAAPHFLARVYCGQMAGWIGIPLGTEIGLGSGDIVLDGDPAPPRKGAQQPPTFWRMSIVAKWSPISATQLLSSCLNLHQVTPGTQHRTSVGDWSRMDISRLLLLPN